MFNKKKNVRPIYSTLLRFFVISKENENLCLKYKKKKINFFDIFGTKKFQIDIKVKIVLETCLESTSQSFFSEIYFRSLSVLNIFLHRNITDFK